MMFSAPVGRGCLLFCTAWAWGVLAARAEPRSAPQEPPPDRAPPQQAEPPARLKLDIDKHVERLLAEPSEVPRFETSVVVEGRIPQVMLERFFGGVDLECGPSFGGAPSVGEMSEYRPHPSPFLDFGALSAALARKFKPKGTPRYFLYRVTRRDEVSYWLREDEIPASWSLTVPGTSFELLEGFETLKEGVVAWRRAYRGERSLLPPSALPLQPWVTATCRPKWR